MSQVIDSTSAADVFAEKASRLNGPWTPALEQLLVLARQSHRDNFNSSATPDGNAWAPRKEEGDGHRLLMDKGPLMQASVGQGPGSIARFEDNGTTLVTGVDLEIIRYARAHNLGFPAGNLPQREFLGLTLQRAQEGDHIVADVVERTIF